MPRGELLLYIYAGKETQSTRGESCGPHRILMRATRPESQTKAEGNCEYQLSMTKKINIRLLVSRQRTVTARPISVMVLT